MKVILSPTKTLNRTHRAEITRPIFDHEAELLRSSVASLSIKRLQTFFKCSKDIATQTKDYYVDENRYEAIKTYDGIGFRTLLKLETIDYHDLYIVSGLYGLLRASDGIKPYRLDLIHPKKGSLVSFWKPKLYEHLKDEDIIYLCISLEYEVLFDERLPLVFVDIRIGEKKASSVEAKKVRAAFSHYLLKHQGLKLEAFEFDHYMVTQIDTKFITIKKR